ncbi:MAG TPA: hypothetical protein VE132_02165 [Micromonosporaceae bacterium]|jgi:hypothetical protein|nr:hypothetical protein [Micromonosporaceae bacterium]
MAARGSSTGLTTQDLNGIRTTLESGRKPKVVFTEAAGQIAGQAGQVVALRDPAEDEWVVVRFGRDELPFAPVDLAVPPRGSTRRTASRRAATPAEPRLAADTPPAAARPSAKPTTSAPPAAIPPQRQENPMPNTPSSTVDTTVPAAPARRAEAPTNDQERPARKVSAPRQPKVKAPPSLTVTLSYTDGDWFVGAQQGSKSLAKPYAIKAGEALRMVGLLDVPGVHEAVEQIIAAERAEANAHAERLRSELAEIEARLADLPKLT